MFKVVRGGCKELGYFSNAGKSSGVRNPKTVVQLYEMEARHFRVILKLMEDQIHTCRDRILRILLDDL
jgi:hypothetical protein